MENCVFWCKMRNWQQAGLLKFSRWGRLQSLIFWADATSRASKCCVKWLIVSLESILIGYCEMRPRCTIRIPQPPLRLHRHKLRLRHPERSSIWQTKSWRGAKILTHLSALRMFRFQHLVDRISRKLLLSTATKLSRSYARRDKSNVRNSIVRELCPDRNFSVKARVK